MPPHQPSRTSDALRDAIRHFVTELEKGMDKRAGLRADQVAAVAELLARLGGELRPAMPAISGRLQVAGSSVAGAPGEPPQEQSQRHGEARGALLHGDAAPRKDDAAAEHGALRGRGLFLLEDGAYAELSYAGTWDKRPGGVTRWEATLTPLTPEQVAQGYRLEPLLEKLHASLTSRAAALPRQNEELARETARVRAILELLRP